MHHIYKYIKAGICCFSCVQTLTTLLRDITDFWVPPLLFVYAGTMNACVLVIGAFVAVANATTDDDVKAAAQAFVKEAYGNKNWIKKIK